MVLTDELSKWPNIRRKRTLRCFRKNYLVTNNILHGVLLPLLGVAEMSPDYVVLDVRSCRKNQGNAALQEIVRKGR